MPRHIAKATDASEDDKRPHAPQGESHLDEASHGVDLPIHSRFMLSK